MKSRLFKIILPLSLVFFLASCGSINSVKVDAYKKVNKVALISIFAKDEIDTSKVEDGSLVAFVVNKTANSDSTKMDDKISALKSHVLRKSRSIFGFRMVPEKQVIGRKAYKSINDSNKNMANLIAPAGYKRLFSNEKELIATAFKGVKADAGMIVSLQMRLVKGIGALGVGKVFLWADMTFYLVDRQGNLIMHKTVSNESDSHTLRIKGIFNGNDLKGMAIEAVEKDLKDIDAWVKEELKKPAKKA